jgi:tetratricopeptide (TPR) repeat protein
LGRLHEGIDILEADAKVLEGTDDVALAATESRLAAALWGLGRYEEASTHLERALTLAERHELSNVQIEALGSRAVILQATGRNADAIALWTAVVELADRRGSTRRQAFGRMNLGDALLSADQPGGAERTEAAVELARRIGDGFSISLGLNNLAVSRYFTGNWDAAEAIAQQAVDSAPDAYQRDTLRLPRLLLHVARGRHSEAVADLAAFERLATSDEIQDQASVAIARTTVALWDAAEQPGRRLPADSVRVLLDTLGLFIEGYRLLWPLAAEAALRNGARDELHALVDAALSAPGDGLPPYLDAQVRRFRSLLAAAEGREHEVEGGLRHAVRILGELGYPYFRAQAQSDLGRWLLDQDRRVDAAPVLAEARDTFTRLGARPALARLDALVPVGR